MKLKGAVTFHIGCCIRSISCLSYVHCIVLGGKFTLS